MWDATYLLHDAFVIYHLSLDYRWVFKFSLHIPLLEPNQTYKQADIR